MKWVEFELDGSLLFEKLLVVVGLKIWLIVVMYMLNVIGIVVDVVVIVCGIDVLVLVDGL